MKDLEVSTRTRALLDAAKSDAPSQLAKAKIWGGVAATTAAAAGVGASAGSVAAMGSGKLMVVGALFGSAVTVGLAMALMHVGPLAPASEGARLRAQSHAEVAPPRPAAPAAPAPAAPDPAAVQTIDLDDAPAAPTTAATPARAIRKPRAARSPAAVDRDELLEREGFLVSEARGALVRGDAKGALSAVHAAQALDSHALDPEELALEARALRAQGSAAAAAEVEARLRARYPDHALAR